MDQDRALGTIPQHPNSEAELREHGAAMVSQALKLAEEERKSIQLMIKLSKRDVVILHPLGVWSGTTLWMQEVVNRFYYSAINAFVYAGQPAERKPDGIIVSSKTE